MYRWSSFCRYTYEGAQWEMERITLETWNEQCESAINNGFVKKYKDKYCIDRRYQLPSDWFTKCGEECERAARCDPHPPMDTLLKVASQSLREASPDAHTFLARSRLDMTNLSNVLWYGGKGGSADHSGNDRGDSSLNRNHRWRQLVCDYVNAIPLEQVNAWLPGDATLQTLQTGCRLTSQQSVCSGHGTCETPNGTSIAGQDNVVGVCVCALGYDGEMCDVDICGQYDASVALSGCAGHGTCKGGVANRTTTASATPTATAAAEGVLVLGVDKEPDTPPSSHCKCSMGWAGPRCASVDTGNLPAGILRYYSPIPQKLCLFGGATCEALAISDPAAVQEGEKNASSAPGGPPSKVGATGGAFVWLPEFSDPMTYTGYLMSKDTGAPKLVKAIQPSAGIRIAMITLATLASVKVVLFMALAYVHRKAPVMLFAQPLFM